MEQTLSRVGLGPENPFAVVVAGCPGVHERRRLAPTWVYRGCSDNTITSVNQKGVAAASEKSYSQN